MKIEDINKGWRILILIALIFLGNFIWYYLFLSAPTESQNWFINKPIWKVFAIGMANIGLILAEGAILFPEISNRRKGERK